jgi:DNA-binding MarR family transcriptional regulator
MDMNVEERIKTTATLPPERRTIIHLMLVNNHIQDVLAQALKPHDVSIQQFNVLRILRGQKGEPANLSTLNERMVSRMSNTTRLVDKLILKGLTARNTCSENRRKVEIRLTEEGISALSTMDRAVERAEKELMGALDPKELIVLNKLLDQIALKYE